MAKHPLSGVEQTLITAVQITLVTRVLKTPKPGVAVAVLETPNLEVHRTPKSGISKPRISRVPQTPINGFVTTPTIRVRFTLDARVNLTRTLRVHTNPDLRVTHTREKGGIELSLQPLVVKFLYS